MEIQISSLLNSQVSYYFLYTLFTIKYINYTHINQVYVLPTLYPRLQSIYLHYIRIRMYSKVLSLSSLSNRYRAKRLHRDIQALYPFFISKERNGFYSSAKAQGTLFLYACICTCTYFIYLFMYLSLVASGLRLSENRDPFVYMYKPPLLQVVLYNFNSANQSLSLRFMFMS